MLCYVCKDSQTIVYMKQADTSTFWLLKTLLHMKIEFQNSTVRLSFLYCIANIKIAWINLYSSHCPHTKQFHRAHNRIMLGSKFAKKGHYIKCVLQMKHFRKSIFVIWWIAKQSVFLISKKASNKVPTYTNINILGLKLNVL